MPSRVYLLPQMLFYSENVWMQSKFSNNGNTICPHVKVKGQIQYGPMNCNEVCTKVHSQSHFSKTTVSVLLETCQGIKTSVVAYSAEA